MELVTSKTGNREPWQVFGKRQCVIKWFFGITNLAESSDEVNQKRLETGEEHLGVHCNSLGKT